MKMSRFTLCLLAVFILVPAAFAQVGHTSVGHVDTLTSNWSEITGDQESMDPAETECLPLSEDLAPQGTGDFGILELPGENTYSLSLLGGMRAIYPPLAGSGGISSAVTHSINGTVDVGGGQNMLLLKNTAGKWDGYPNDPTFSVVDNTSWDLNPNADEVEVQVVVAKATEASSGGGGGGGCSAGFLAPAALILLAPLFLLRKRP